jgi:hypothetical protein
VCVGGGWGGGGGGAVERAAGCEGILLKILRLSAYVTFSRWEGRQSAGGHEREWLGYLTLLVPLLLSAKGSFLPRKDLESWHCYLDLFLLIDIIWNPIHPDRIRQNRTYWYITSTWQYMNCHFSILKYIHTGTYKYVLLKGHVACSHTQAVF